MNPGCIEAPLWTLTVGHFPFPDSLVTTTAHSRTALQINPQACGLGKPYFLLLNCWSSVVSGESKEMAMPGPGTFYPDGQIVLSVSMVTEERRVRWEEAESALQSGQDSCD